MECHERSEKRFGPAHAQTTRAINLLIELYDAWHAAEPEGGHDAAAEQWRSRIAQNDSASPREDQP
jgi:hypothetical protein